MGYGFSTGGGGEESELRELESRVYALPVAAIESRVAALENQAWLLWNSPPGAGCLITIMFQVRDSGSGAAISGADVEVMDSGGATVAGGVSGVGGVFVATVFGVDSYAYSASAAGYATATGSVGTVSCGGTAAVAVTLASSGVSTGFTGSVVTACSSTPDAGATVTIADSSSGAVYYTGTTDGSGDFSGTWSAPSGTSATIKVVDSTYGTYTSPTTLNPTGGTATYNLAPPWTIVAGDLVPTTLTGSDNLATGTFTMTKSGCTWTGVASNGDTWRMGYGDPDGTGSDHFNCSMTTTGGGGGDADAASVTTSPFHAVFSATLGGRVLTVHA